MFFLTQGLSLDQVHDLILLLRSVIVASIVVC